LLSLDSEFIRVRLLSQSGAGTLPGELTVGLVLFGLLPAGFVAAERRGLFALLTRPRGAPRPVRPGRLGLCRSNPPDLRFDLSFPTNHPLFQ
jgi:hypothetical protein